MTFNEACKILGIEEYAERIYNSSSHGELFHTAFYFQAARYYADKTEDEKQFFRNLFNLCVESCEKEWKRPESCFQHMDRLMPAMLRQARTHAQGERDK